MNNLTKVANIHDLLKKGNMGGGEKGAIVPRATADRIRALASGQSSVPQIGAPDLEVVFFCDTTGSMSSYFERVRESMVQIADQVTRKGVRAQFAVYAYKNHSDEGCFDGVHPFLHQPFSADPHAISKALTRVFANGGGDGLCAIEDAFHHLNQAIGASLAVNTALVGIVIGDMPPHGVVDSIMQCPHRYDYREEVECLRHRGFTFYSVFCYKEDELKSERKQEIQNYYRWLARITGGKYLDLNDIEALVDVLLGICMKETGHLDSFIAEAEKRPALPQQTKRLLLQLKAV